MKLKAIGLTTVCSLLSIASLQSVQANSLRADQGQNGWTDPAKPYSSSPYALNPGVITANAVSIGNSNSQLLVDDAGLPGNSATEYNWYASPTSFTQALTQVTPLEQIVVYTLGSNVSPLLLNNSQSVNISGDTEIEFNYGAVQAQLSQNPAATAQFVIGGVTYSALVANIYLPTSQNDFIFSPSNTFVGSLITSTDDSGDTITSLSSSLGEWTKAGGTTSAPEIDSSSAISALTLLDHE